MITGLGCSSVADCMLTCSRPWIWSPAQKKKKSKKKTYDYIKSLEQCNKANGNLLNASVKLQTLHF